MILLSFDIEEFDMPFEYGKSIPFEEQMQISIEGTEKILNLLEKHQIKATFFSTATFAIHAPEIMTRIVENGHEIASHTYFHSNFKVEHLLQSKIKLEELTKQKVYGFRMPRMYPVDELEIKNAGYLYNSSMNPTYLPGRYNNFTKPRTYFKEQSVWQIPASVTPWVRFPLFWLSFHNLPLKLYLFLCHINLKKDKYLNIYFHPWEFTNLDKPHKYNFPKYISKNSNEKMEHRLEQLILKFKKKNIPFISMMKFVHHIEKL